MFALHHNPARHLADAAAALAVALLVAVGGAVLAYAFAVQRDFVVAAIVAGLALVSFRLLRGVAFERLDMARAAMRARRADAAAARIAARPMPRPLAPGVAATRRLVAVRPSAV